MISIGLLVLLSLSCQLQPSLLQGIEDVRLVNGTYGEHMGRVEVQVNGTWGAICGNSWGYVEARTACRMLNLRTVVCRTDGQAFSNVDDLEVPILIQEVDCVDQNDLDECNYELAGPDVTCQSFAEAVCVRRVIGPPRNVSQVNATSTTVTIAFELPTIPEGVEYLRFSVYTDNDVSYSYSTYNGTTRYQHLIGGLEINTTYSLRMRVDVRYSVCARSGYLWGNFSSYVNVTTHDRAQEPAVSLRLIPPQEGVDFMGRLEVRYNGQWGTICDDGFYIPEANVACQSLGFTRGAQCYIQEARFGRGTGPIWMDNVDCSQSHDVLEQCDFNGWGVNNCNHGSDVGVICLTDEYSLPVTGVNITSVTGFSLTVNWEAFNFPPLLTNAGYQVQYSYSGRRSSIQSTASTETTVTLRELVINVTYSVRVRAWFHFSEYCIARRRAYGDYSNQVMATTRETAPTAPPSFFHVTPLNSTAILFQWDLPPTDFQNGIIRGYRLFLQHSVTKVEQTFIVSDLSVFESIASGLDPGTTYICSMLAYTNSDGPRTLHLTTSTYQQGFTPIVTQFGVNGDGLDRVVIPLTEQNVIVHCDTNTPNVTVTWFFSNGTQIGTNDRDIRQANYHNGTNVLQIASYRNLDYCDAGIYTCVAESSMGERYERNFTLRVARAPPTPSVVYPVEVGSTWIKIAWRELSCDGGHQISGFNIRYREALDSYLVASNEYIYNINASRLTYTLQNLEPSTPYNISIQARSTDFLVSTFSTGNVITTLPPAPSPPRSVRARLVYVSRPIVEVRWREPAVTNGIITNYTVSIIPFNLPNRPNDLTVTLPASQIQTINKTFSGHVGAVNITVNITPAWYVFRVRASNLVNGVENHGEFSQANSESTLFVPSADRPVPQNLSVVTTTNSTISLAWDYPTPPYDAIARFLVIYTASIEWVSPQRQLVLLEERRQLTTPNNTVLITQLTPSTTYRFSVSAITERNEEGAEMVLYANTTEPTGVRLAFFQLRIAPIASCYRWMESSSERISLIKSELMKQLRSSLCPTCQLTNSTITEAELSCQVEDLNQIFFRARITGSTQYSTSGLVELLQWWISSSTASLQINSVRYRLDSQCATSLDSLYAQNCAVVPMVTTSRETTMTTTNAKTTAASITLSVKEDNFSVGEIVGVFIGLLIIILLGVLIIMLVVFIIMRKSSNGTLGTTKLTEDESAIVFSEMNKKIIEDDEKEDLENL